ncbi:unnamed protein product [Amoebophrya sp. A120]|nr:unnamed protein product [Amoebophrya sp. A120]|eukprot:GSA120T00007794001.1
MARIFSIQKLAAAAAAASTVAPAFFTGVKAVKMNNVFNDKVKSASVVQRSLGKTGVNAGPISHSGVLMKTESGKEYIAHHPGPGQPAVVTDAKHMSNDWKEKEKLKVEPGKTVGSAFNSAGGSKSNSSYFNPAAPTCHGFSNTVADHLTTNPQLQQKALDQFMQDPDRTKPMNVSNRSFQGQMLQGAMRHQEEVARRQAARSAGGLGRGSSSSSSSKQDGCKTQ